MFGSFGDPPSLLLHVTQHEGLQDAIGTARLVNRVKGEAGLPTIDFDYLDRWRGVLARIASLVAVREP